MWLDDYREGVASESGMSSQPLGEFAGWYFLSLNSASLGQVGKDTGRVTQDLLAALGHLCVDRSGRSPLCK